MIVKCIANTGKVLLNPTTRWWYNEKYNFNLEVGSKHIVYGISCMDNCFAYLLSVVNEKPTWWPAELFEVSDYFLSPIFYSDLKIRKNYKGEDTIFAIFSYKEMVCIESHYKDLLDVEPGARAIFYKRKAEIDEFEEMRGMKK